MAYKQLNQYLTSLELASDYTGIPTDLPANVVSEAKELIELLKVLGVSLSDLQYIGIDDKNMVCRPRVYKQDGKLVLFFHPGCVVNIPRSAIFVEGKTLLLEESNFELRVKTGIENPPKVAPYNTILNALPDKGEFVKKGKFLDLMDKLGVDEIGVNIKGVYQKQFPGNMAYTVLAIIPSHPEYSGFYKTTATGFRTVNDCGTNRNYVVSRKDWNIGGKTVNSHEFRLVK